MPIAPYINSTNARELALRSAEARREARAKLQLAAAQSSPDQLYVAERIAQVREQIRRVNDRIATEDDAQRLDRLVSAVYRLTELERVLSGRPLPGQLKPIAQRPTRSSNEPLH